jgi:hypothetical protein
MSLVGHVTYYLCPPYNPLSSNFLATVCLYVYNLMLSSATYPNPRHQSLPIWALCVSTVSPPEINGYPHTSSGDDFWIAWEETHLTKHHAMKAYWGVEVQLHSFFDLGTRWRWVVSCTPQPLYPQGKSPWHSLDRGLGRPPYVGRDMEKDGRDLLRSTVLTFAWRGWWNVWKLQSG